jgi:hypothetical protein
VVVRCWLVRRVRERGSPFLMPLNLDDSIEVRKYEFTIVVFDARQYL